MSRSRIFRTSYRGRGRKWRLVADALNLIGRVLNNVTINGRDAELTRNGLALYVETGGLDWCGVVVQKGSHYYDDDIAAERDKFGGTIGNPSLGPKTVLVWFVDDSSAPYYTEGPIPSSMPANMEMEYVANLASAIHVH